MRECREIAHLIAPYLYAEADPAQRATVEAHLASHPDCERRVTEMRQALEALPTRAPTDEEMDAILRSTRAALDRARPQRRRWPAWVAAGVAALLILGAVYLWRHPKPEREVVVTPRQPPKPEVVQPPPMPKPSAPERGVVEQPAPPKPERAPGRVPTPGPAPRPRELASLGDLAGKPQVRRGGTDLWQPAESRQRLAAGDQVRTGPGERAVVGLDDGTRLTLEPDTTLELTGARGRPAAARLLRGQLGAWVAPGTDPFFIHTPQGRAQATGTRFAVDASRELTTVAVFNGRVELASEQGQVTLDPHSQATLRAGEAPSQPIALTRGPMMNGAAGVVSDDFDGPILNRSMWILRDVDPGIHALQKGGVLHITGTTTGEGLELPSGVATYYFPRQSFSISVAVQVPNESELGPVLELRGATGSERFEFAFSQHEGYTTGGYAQTGEMDFTVRQPFGDEPTAWHTMRIAYDADTGDCSADVDGQSVGGMRFRPDWFTFFMGVPLMESGYAADVRFDNFRMDLRGAAALPRIEVPSQAPMAQHYPRPVLWLGPPDSWESMAVWAPFVIEQGGRYLMYYTGGRLTGGWMWSHVGLATSSDGIHWTKYEDNPVLTDAGEPCVLYGDFGEARAPYYKMYYREYLKGTRHSSVIALATSPDGINWTRQGVVLGLEPTGNRVTAPNVLYQPDGGVSGDRYLMYYHSQIGDTWAVRLATSQDGVHFERRGSMEGQGSRVAIDGLSVSEGQVLRIGATYQMWYRARSYDPRWRGSIAHATSPDGFHWTKTRGRLVVEGSGQPGDVFCVIKGLTVLRDGDTIRLWYTIGPHDLHGSLETLIGYAAYQLGKQRGPKQTPDNRGDENT